MAESKRTFIAGKMNMDIDERMLPDGQYRSASNITIEATGGSNMGAAQNAKGNIQLFDVSVFLLYNQGISTTGIKTIGAVTHEPLSLIYWFISSVSFDGIFEYNQKTNVTSLILGSTTGQLGFDATALITGVNYIPTKDGGFLLWTDNLNPPRRINISRVRSYSINDSRIDIDINVILRPPLKSPKITLKNDTDNIDSNNLEEKFLYFSYRYKYVDNEFSSMSPFSSVAFNAKPLSFDPTTGDNIGMLNKNNLVNISFETGNQFVKEIQILARDTRSLNVMIVETLNKSDEGFANNSFASFIFRNNKIYAALTSDQVTRMFDNVPLKAQAQEIIGNRLIYGNYTQFRDVQQLSYTVDFGSNTTANVADPKRTFRSDRDYEVGIVYSDEYGRLTTVLTSKDNNTGNNSSSSVYIPPSNSDKPNFLKATIKSLPPSWATNYRLYIKQTKKDYYNLFPISFQVKGEYRYIQISESDRDKVSVGQYIIFKTANTLPTHSNKKFKVLEIELKTLGQLNPASAAGLYIKIKPDNISGSSFLAAPTMITTNSAYWKTLRTYQSSSGGQIPYCFNAPVLHYDTVFYRSGSDFFTSALNFAPAIGLTGSITKDDVRLRVKIVPDPLNQNSSNATHFIINTNPANQNSWTAPVLIPSGSTYSVNAQVPSSGGNVLLNFGVGNYVLGDVYVFNIRGYYFNSISSRASVKSPRGGSGLPGTFNNSYSSLTPTMPVDGGSPNPVVSPWQYNYTGELSVAFAGPIYIGAKITITVREGQGCTCTPVDNFTTILPIATRNYPSFEEFFWEECTGVTIDVVNPGGTDPSNINYAFRYVNSQISVSGGCDGESTWINNPIAIQNGGSTLDANGNALFKSALFFWADAQSNSCGRTHYDCSATLEQAVSPTYIVETVPIEVETPIFHETTKTYPIKNGFHGVGWDYYSATSTAVAGGFNVLLTSTDMHYFSVGDSVWLNGFPHNVAAVTSERQITIFSVTSFSGSGTIYSMQGESDQTALGSANVILNSNNENSDCNAFCYGNGLESYRIRDSFNNATMNYSIRASTVIDDYEQEEKFASLTYSGVYRGSSSINRLNEFNLSTANFKNLEKDYGSIQKLYTRDSDLLVLHQDKITSVLFGKNLLVDALGGGQVASIPEVLGNQVPYDVDNGISNDPASFAVDSNNLYFTDAKRGVVIEILGNQGVMEISSKGMRNSFRDLLTENLNTQKIGAYDPYYNMYSLTTNTTRNTLCSLSISRPSLVVFYTGTSSSTLLFSINTNESWTVSLIDTGFGTDWLLINQLSGTGSQSIYGTTSLTQPPVLPRTITVRVSYCNKYTDFLLTQQKYSPIVEPNIIIRT